MSEMYLLGIVCVIGGILCLVVPDMHRFSGRIEEFVESGDFERLNGMRAKTWQKASGILNLIAGAVLIAIATINHLSLGQ